MGSVYNRQIYERRLEVLDEMLLRYANGPVEDLRILDIGCGSGFYTGYWAARRVRDYLGVDISSDTVEHLSDLYPQYRFLQADVTNSDIATLADLPPFDVVTIFDVFYHMVNDDRFANAVAHIGALVADTACVLVMDQLSTSRYQLSRHVVYRGKDSYLATFQQHQFDLVDDELLFHFLVPPLSGNRVIDYLAAAVFKATGLVIRISDRLASWLAKTVRRLDTRLRTNGRRVSNSEFLVFRKSAE